MIFNKYTMHFYHYDNFYLNTDKKPSLVTVQILSYGSGQHLVLKKVTMSLMKRLDKTHASSNQS